MFASIDWLKENLDNPDLILLDARPRVSFQYGHVPNSQSLSLEHVIKTDRFGSNLVLDTESAANLFSSLGIDDGKTVVVLGDAMDPSAARIVWTLLYYGHENTRILDANVSELKQRGFEFVRKTHTPAPTKFTPKINSNIRIESDYLKDHLKDFQILDARTIQEYMAGHLPGAVLFPFTNGLSYDTMFQEGKTLNDMFQNQVNHDKEIVCYCMHGHRASSLYLQLKKAGYDKVRLYDGSFVEWYGKRLPLE